LIDFVQLTQCTNPSAGVWSVCLCSVNCSTLTVEACYQQCTCVTSVPVNVSLFSTEPAVYKISTLTQTSIHSTGLKLTSSCLSISSDVEPNSSSRFLLW